MKRRNIITYFTSLCIVAFAVTAYAAGAPSAVKSLTKSVVTVTADGNFGTETVTGIVTDDKYIVTGFSDTDGSKNIKVTYGDESVPAEVYAVDKSKNLSVLKLSREEGIKGTRPVKFYINEKKKDADAYVVGRDAQNDNGAIKNGAILEKGTLSVSGMESIDIYTVNIPVTREDSNAILADSNGNIMGICLYDGNTNVNKAVTSAEITEFLDAKEIPYKKATVTFIMLITAIILAAAAAVGWAVYKAIQRRSKSRPMLEGTNGEFAGQCIALSEENVSIGRDPKYCQIVILYGDKVSRCHCSVRYDKNKNMFMLTDLSSTHGTYLASGEKLEPNVPKYLSEGAVFKVGDSSNVFKVRTGGYID